MVYGKPTVPRAKGFGRNHTPWGSDESYIEQREYLNLIIAIVFFMCNNFVLILYLFHQIKSEFDYAQMLGLHIYILKSCDVNAILDILCSRFKEFNTINVTSEEYTSTSAATS